MRKSLNVTIQGQKSLKRSQILLYALPVMGTTFLIGPLAILQGVYAKYFGLGLTTIAAVLLVSRLFDAITDPIIGYFSDLYHDRCNSRKPFVIVGGLLFIISSYFLYVPSKNVSAIYFLVCFLAFYLAFTMFEISHLSWGGDLGISSKEKNRIFAWRAVSVNLGSLLFFAMPLLPVFETNAFTPQTLQWSCMTAGCLLLPLLYLCATNVPNSGSANMRSKNGITQKKVTITIKTLRLCILDNNPLLLFLAAYSCIGIGVGLWGTLIFLFVESFLGLGEQFALVYVISYSVSTLSLAGWSKLVNRSGKQRCWGLAAVMIVIGLLSTGFLTPSQTSHIPLLLCMVVTYSGFAALSLLAPSMLAEIIDFGTWKFGHDRAGIYFSLFSLVSKMNVAIAGALGLGLAGFYGFDATTMSQTPEAVFGLHLVMIWLPVPIVLLSIAFVTFIPINARRHAIIRRKLDSRKRKSEYFG